MLSMDLDDADRSNVWRVTACVLHLGDIDFEEKELDGGTGTAILKSSEAALELTSQLLQVPAARLAEDLCTVTITNPRETVTKPLDRAKACGERGCLPTLWMPRPRTHPRTPHAGCLVSRQ
jgi:myosin heavy subunit